MKKLICSFAIFSLVTLAVVKARGQQNYLGVRAGTNLANESVIPSPASGATTSIHAGFLAGVQYEYWFDDTWSLGGQVLYDQKGAHEIMINTVDVVGSGFTDLSLNYLEIPILLKASFGSGSFSPYIFAGPSSGLYLSGKEHSSNWFYGQTLNTTKSVADSDMNFIDLSAVFGAGASFRLSSGQMLYVDAAYALGLINISYNQRGEHTIVTSRDIRIAAGILFPFHL